MFPLSYILWAFSSTISLIIGCSWKMAKVFGEGTSFWPLSTHYSLFMTINIIYLFRHYIQCLIYLNLFLSIIISRLRIIYQYNILCFIIFCWYSLMSLWLKRSCNLSLTNSHCIIEIIFIIRISSCFFLELHITIILITKLWFLFLEKLISSGVGINISSLLLLLHLLSLVQILHSHRIYDI